MKTTVTIKSLPAGLARAIALLDPKGRDVEIEAKETAYVSSDSQCYMVRNAIVPDLDVAFSVQTRTGVWGGNNGFNKPPADRAWDPIFDDQPRDVPLGGAIVVGTVGRFCSVYVHPTTFAERYIKNDVVRDALLEGRTSDAAAIASDDANLSDEECAILYAHVCYKSGEYRKRVTTKYTAALESCVARGLVKRASNGACTATVAGKALRNVWDKRGEAMAWRS